MDRMNDMTARGVEVDVGDDNDDGGGTVDGALKLVISEVSVSGNGTRFIHVRSLFFDVTSHA